MHFSVTSHLTSASSTRRFIFLMSHESVYYLTSLCIISRVCALFRESVHYFVRLCIIDHRRIHSKQLHLLIVRTSPSLRGYSYSVRTSPVCVLLLTYSPGYMKYLPKIRFVPSFRGGHWLPASGLNTFWKAKLWEVVEMGRMETEMRKMMQYCLTIWARETLLYSVIEK